MKDKKAVQLAYIAQLYYNEGMNQQEIANIIGINRASISRLLNEALKKKVVTIKVSYPWRIASLEKRLKDVFPQLKDACVLACEHNGYEESLQKIGLFAGEYLLEAIQPKSVIGVGWGKALHEIIKNIPEKYLPEVEIVQVVGATGYTGLLEDGPMIARNLSEKFSCKCRYLHVPLIVESKAVRDSLIKDKAVHQTLEFASHADILITGIGSVLMHKLYTLKEVGYVTDQEVEELKEAGAVGDILGMHYTLDGEILDIDINHRTLTIPPEKLTQVARSIAIAGHEGKAEAIIGAIRGKFINTLITDNFAAERILSSVE